MGAEVILQRNFHLLNSEGRNLDVVACLRSLGGGTPMFSVTSQNGILQSRHLPPLPTDVRDDLQGLISVHSADQNGVPMHAVENAVYCLQNGNFSNAQRSLRSPATVEDLVRLYARVETLISKQGPENPITVRMRKVADAAKRVLETRKAYVAGKSDDMFGHLENAYLLAFLTFDAVRKCNDAAIPKKVEGTRPDRRARIARFEKVYPTHKLDSVIRGGKTEFHARVSDVVHKNMLVQAVENYVKTVCAPVWKEKAERAMESLSRPDFRIDGRPEPTLDPRTFDGFMNCNGIEFSAVRVGKCSVPPFRGSNEWSCEFKSHDGKTFSLPFFLGDDRQPTAEMVLESLQDDSSSIAFREKDDWISSMGYDDGIDNVRMGERIFDAIIRNDDRMKSFFGESVYVSLLTEVGDYPPMLAEDFAPETASLAR